MRLKEEVIESLCFDYEQICDQLEESEKNFLRIINDWLLQEAVDKEVAIKEISDLFLLGRSFFPLDISLFSQEGAGLRDAQNRLKIELEEIITAFANISPSKNIMKPIAAMARAMRFSLSGRDLLKSFFSNKLTSESFREIDALALSLFQAKVMPLCLCLGSLAYLIQYASLISSQEIDEHEIIILKRHEECTNFTKSFGFSADTDLTAFDPSCIDYKVQSVLSLYSSQKIQEYQLRLLNQLFNPQSPLSIRLISSPVRRATSTAIHAVAGPEFISSVFIDNVFSERKLASKNWSLKLFSPLIQSGTETRSAAQIEETFQQLQYRGVHSSQFTQEQSKQSANESSEEYQMRITRAKLIIESKIAENNLTIVVAHGDLNRDLMHSIIGSAVPKLGYGESYVLIRINNNLVELMISDRFGALKEANLLEQKEEPIIRDHPLSATFT